VGPLGRRRRPRERRSREDRGRRGRGSRGRRVEAFGVEGRELEKGVYRRVEEVESSERRRRRRRKERGIAVGCWGGLGLLLEVGRSGGVFERKK